MKRRALLIGVEMDETYIRPCVRFAEQGNPAAAHEVYREMVNRLRRAFSE